MKAYQVGDDFGDFGLLGGVSRLNFRSLEESSVLFISTNVLRGLRKEYKREVDFIRTRAKVRFKLLTSKKEDKKSDHLSSKCSFLKFMYFRPKIFQSKSKIHKFIRFSSPKFLNFKINLSTKTNSHTNSVS